jgi:hypothetical protein
LEDELVPDMLSDTDFDFVFENCALKAKGTLPDPFFLNCLNNVDPQFFDIVKSSYRLKDISPCINVGIPAGVLTDIEGNARDGEPDLGAFEFKE